MSYENRQTTSVWTNYACEGRRKKRGFETDTLAELSSHAAGGNCKMVERPDGADSGSAFPHTSLSHAGTHVLAFVEYHSSFTGTATLMNTQLYENLLSD